MQDTDYKLSAKKSEAMTVSAVAAGFPYFGSLLEKEKRSTFERVEFIVETAAIRYTLDGTAPTASVGIPANVGDRVVITGNNDILNFKAIRSGSVSASIFITYYAS